MYVIKICKNKEILDVLHYERFENVVADIADLTIFDSSNVSTDILESCTEPPRLYSAGESEDGVADDFEFRFKDGVYIYAGRVLTEEEKVRIERYPKVHFTTTECFNCICLNCDNTSCKNCDKCHYTAKRTTVTDCPSYKKASAN